MFLFLFFESSTPGTDRAPNIAQKDTISNKIQHLQYFIISPEFVFLYSSNSRYMSKAMKWFLQNTFKGEISVVCAISRCMSVCNSNE